MDMSKTSPKIGTRTFRRVPLTLSNLTPGSWNTNILPGSKVTIFASRSQLDTFWPDRLLIKNADRWFVHDVLVEGRSQLNRLAPRGLPGGVFRDAVHPPRFWADNVRAGERVGIVVSYVGDSECGEPFEAVVFGAEDPPVYTPASLAEPAGSDPTERVADRVILPTSSGVTILQNMLTTLRLDLPDAPFYLDRITIADAADWVVNDLKLRGRSLLMNSGDLPGVMFSGNQAARPLHVGLVAPGDEVHLTATYVGGRETGCLECTVSGMRTAPDLAVESWSGFLAMSSTRNILPYTRERWLESPQLACGKAFLPRQIVVADADDWVIHVVMTGIRSQFANCGDLTGAAFSSVVVDNLMVLDPVRSDIDFTIEYSYVGPSESGAPFVCGVYGDVVELGQSWSTELRRLVCSGPSPDAVAWRAQRASERGVVVDPQWDD